MMLEELFNTEIGFQLFLIYIYSVLNSKKDQRLSTIKNTDLKDPLKQLSNNWRGKREEKEKV